MNITALHEAIEANDFLEVPDELAAEAIRQYGCGFIGDEVCEPLVETVLKTRPELAGFNGYDFAGVLYRDYMWRAWPEERGV